MPPIHPSRLPELFRNARQAEAKGNTIQAKQGYEAILQVNPKLAEVQFQLGQLLLKLERPEAAAACLEKAARLRPDERVIWQLWARAVRQIADAGRIEALLKTAKLARIDRAVLIQLQDMLAPKSAKSSVSLGAAPKAQVEQAVRLLRGGEYRQAIVIAEKLHKAHPDVSPLADILAYALAEDGQVEKAERYFLRAIELDPTYAETRANYGQFLLRQERYDEAAKMLKSAIDLLPDMPIALTNLGTALRRMERNTAAMRPLKRALELDPSLVAARYELVEAMLNDYRFDEIEPYLRPLMDRDVPDAANIILNARRLSGLNQNEAAEAEFDRAIAAAPDSPKPVAAKAVLLQFLGRFDEAAELSRKVIALEPLEGEHYQNFVLTRKLKADDPLIPQMEAAFDNPDVTELNKVSFGFALAKALEDSGQYEKVFTYLRPANDIIHSRQPFDLASRQRFVRDVIAECGKVDFAARKTPGATGFGPIFVTGVPRSGTTLVEQIIASHSRVTGGGELGVAFAELRMATAGEGAGAFKCDVSDQELAAIGREIAATMRELVPGADVMTDKSVQTYSLIGPVKLALPKSRIIVVHRDPRDSALSMYKNMFGTGRHLYTYNLTQLGEFYRLFRDIVDFWREKTPEWIYEIHYEDLIANPEEESRKLIAACGLDWEDACLSFHENKRRVDTLSVHQVRQPIYSSSRQAWRRYESELGELFDALGPDYMPKDA